MKFPLLLVSIAAQEIGVTEVNGTNCGPRVDIYKGATTLNPHEGWPWCAAFVDWCVRETLTQAGIAETATFRRPTTASAWDLVNWSEAQDDSTQTKRAPGIDIQAGDILVYTFSHTGLAAADADPHRATVATIEGNTDVAGSRDGGGVYRRTRGLELVKARIRFQLPEGAR